MKISIEEIVDGITELAQTYLPELVRVDYDLDFFAINNRKKKDYPRLFIMVNESITFGENINTIPITLRFADISDGMKNTNLKDKAIKSDMTQAASKLLDLMKGEDFFDEAISFQAIPFDRELNDGLSGVDLTVNCVTSKPCVDESDIPKPPIAPNVNLFTFEDFENISILTYCSDPDGLALELDSVGKPDYGTIELTANDIIKWNKEGASDVAQGLVDYTIKNTAGLTDSGTLTLAFEEIDITIDTPTEGQEIPSDEDITVAFTVTPATQDYISAIALVVDGTETEKRTPYSTTDFTIDAGTLTEAAHTIQIRAYDTDDNQVFETPVRNITVAATFAFGNALLADDATDYVSFSSGLEALNGATKASIHAWVNVANGERLIIGQNRSGGFRFSIFIFTSNPTRLYLQYRNASVGQSYIDFSPFFGQKVLVEFFYDGTASTFEDAIKCRVNNVYQTVIEDQIGYPISLPADVTTDFYINRNVIDGGFYGKAAYNNIVICNGITESESDAFWNNGNGADARDCFSNIVAYWKCDQPDGDTTLIDRVGTATGQLQNFITPPPYFIDFNSYDPATYNPFEVYDVVAELGQSNMDGRDGDLANPDYPFESTNGYWWDGSTPHNIVTNRDVTRGSHANYFCEKYNELSSQKAVMIPAASGGAGTLDSGTDNDWSVNGSLRAEAEAKIDSALAYFNRSSPKCALWCCGESDAGTIFNNPLFDKADAKAAMQDVIDWWQAKYPGSPFFISETGALTTGANEQGYIEIREVQNEIVAENANVFMAFTGAKDFVNEGKMYDTVHYNYIGLKEMGEAFAVSVNQNT